MAVLGHHIVTLEWSMVAFTFLLVSLRLYTRISRSLLYRPLPLTSDIFVVIAWCSFALQACLNTVLHNNNFYDPQIDAKTPEVGGYTTSIALKIYYIQQITYLNCVFAVKASMLSLYEEFFPQYMKWTRRCLNVTIGFVAVSWLLEALLCAFWCLPIHRNWSMDAEYYCSCWNSFAVGVLSLTPHFLSDMIIYIMPLPVLFHLSLPLRQKIGLGVTFSFGFLCIFFAIAYLVASICSSNLAFMYLFSILEQTYAMIVACCPLFRAFCVERRRLSISTLKGRHGDTKKEKDYEVGVLIVELRNDQQRHNQPSAGGVQFLSSGDRSALDKSKGSNREDHDQDVISSG